MRERRKTGIKGKIKKLFRSIKAQGKEKHLIIGTILFLLVIFAVLALCLSRCSEETVPVGDNSTDTMTESLNLPSETTTDTESIQTEPVETEYVSTIDFDKLREENSENVVGYLEIPGTTVSYPVMCHPTDNSFYLTRTPSGSYDAGGSLFMEKENSIDFTDPVTLVYGHNMNGNTECERPYFSFFQYDYSKQEFLDEHSVVNLYLPDRLVKYKVCAAVPYDSLHILYKKDYTDQAQFDALMDKIYAQSGKTYACFSDREKPSGDSPVLILSTCYMWDNYKRYLLVAEAMSEEELSADAVTEAVSDGN